MSHAMPIFVLAGSDQRPGPVPATLEAGDMLSGFKGTLALPSGRCLAAELVARLRASYRFQEPLLVGPRAVYDQLVDCEIIDVSGTLVDTLWRLVEVAQTRFAEDEPIAAIACDVLPTAEEIDELLAAEYDPHAGCRFWWQWVAAEPQAMGASRWKPRYHIRRREGAPLETVYPGHLAILQSGAIRFNVLLSLLSLAYRYRNWTPRQRMPPMLVRGIGMMLGEDCRNLARGQLPILSVSIPWHLLRAYRELQTSRLTVSGLERHATSVLLHRRYRDAERPVVIATTSTVSFAQDIDTQAEFEAACQQAL